MELGKNLLDALYNEEQLSMAEIAGRLGCSQNKVAYWMGKYGIARRDISGLTRTGIRSRFGSWYQKKTINYSGWPLGCILGREKRKILSRYRWQIPNRALSECS